MKKLITILMAMVLMAVTAISATAHHSHDYNPYARPTYYGQSYNQFGYEDYFDSRSYLRRDHYRNLVQRTRYDPYRSYFGYMSPYRGPLFKTRNTQYAAPPGVYETTGVQSTNPFYGHTYVRTYHCHGPGACHYHNVFPDSN